MARLYSFPDPNDRSANAPSIIAPSDSVLGLYNQENDVEMQKVTDKVREWFIQKAKNAYKWSEAEFSGNQCVLKMNIEKIQVPEN